MITFNELLSGNSIADVPHEHQFNLEELLKRINLIRDAWAHPMIVTSGYRTQQQHINIYRKKGIKPPNIPMGSKHLVGAAVDIADTFGRLQAWLKENPSALLSANLYCEEGTDTWVHFQWQPPQSHSTWFKP